MNLLGVNPKRRGRFFLMSDAQASKRTFLDRYGATIVRGGIASIPAALYRYQGELGLTIPQVWFVSALLAYKWDADLPYPSLRKMAGQTGINPRKLHELKSELTSANWLTLVTRSTELGGKDTNGYDFSPLFEKLAELLERDRKDRQPSNGGRTTSQATPHIHRPEPPYVHPGEHTHIQTGEPHEEPVASEPEKKNHHQHTHTTSSTLETPDPRVDDDDFTQRLVNQGVGAPRARELRAGTDPLVISQQVAVYEHLIAEAEKRGKTPPGTGYLICSVEHPEKYPPPPSYRRQVVEAERQRREAGEASQHEAEAAQRQLAERQDQALTHLEDPGARAERQVEIVRRAKARSRKPLAEEEVAYQVREQTALNRRQAEAFFAQHPELYTWALAQSEEEEVPNQPETPQKDPPNVRPSPCLADARLSAGADGDTVAAGAAGATGANGAGAAASTAPVPRGADARDHERGDVRARDRPR